MNGGKGVLTMLRCLVSLEVCAQQLQPDVVTYSGAIIACDHGRLPQCGGPVFPL